MVANTADLKPNFLTKTIKAMNIHDKINMKAAAYLYLTFAQYMQLIKRNLIALTPYYKDRLIRQAEAVNEAETFKKIFGKYRYQLENNI